MALTFSIISVGDVEFLGQVLNAVAMVCGTGDFKQLCICGFIIGLLFIGFQCIFQGGQRINLQHTFVCFLCYMCFFGPSCTVVIEDAQGSAYTRTIDNVPIGVGVAGTAISGIGYGLTNMIEQAYGTVDRQTNYSYAEPLKILNGLRNSAWGDELWAQLDAQCGAGCDTKRAVQNYLSECTMKMIQLTGKSVTSLGNSGLADFYFNNDSYATELPLYDAGTYIGTVSCKAAWPKLTTLVFNHVNNAGFATRLNSMLNLREWTAANTQATQATQTTATDWTAISNAFTFLGLTAATAQDFVRMSILEPVYYQAAQQRYTSQQDISSALAINNAIQQRNTQWAAEQTLFMSASRAFMAFFEGFIYAVTPIMGFLLMVGAFGLSLVGKYFMVLAWIQLWLPCLSICNLYTMQGARNALSSSIINAAEPSFFSVNAAFQQAANWIATGGMLAAATPMLALFLISGSVYAFTSLAGRLQGKDHFNEKSITPDIQSVGPVQAAASAANYDRMTGTLASGAKELMPSIAETAGIQRNVTATESQLLAASENFAASFVRNGGLTSSSIASKSVLENIGRSVGSIRTESGQTIRQIAEQTIGSHVKSEAEMNQVIGQMALSTQAQASGTFGLHYDAQKTADRKRKAAEKAAAKAAAQAAAANGSKGAKNAPDTAQQGAEAESNASAVGAGAGAGAGAGSEAGSVSAPNVSSQAVNNNLSAASAPASTSASAPAAAAAAPANANTAGKVAKAGDKEKEGAKEGETASASSADLPESLAEKLGLRTGVGIGAGGTVTGTSTNSDSASAGTTFTNTNSSSNSATQSKALLSSMTKAVQTAIQETKTQTWSEAKSSAETEGLQDTFAKMESASSSYAEAKAAAEQFGVNSGGRSYAAVAENLRGTEEWKRLQSYEIGLSAMEKSSFSNDVNAFRRMIGDGHGVSTGEAEKAKVMAALHHMAKTGNFETLARSAGNAVLPSMRSETAELSHPQRISPMDYGKAHDRVDGRRRDADAAIFGRTVDVSETGDELPEASYSTGNGMVRAAKVEANSEVEEKAAADRSTTTAAHKQTILENLGKDRENTSMGLKIAGSYLAGENIERIENFAVGFITTEKTPLTVSSEDIKQKITGLSEAQKNFLDRYYDEETDISRNILRHPSNPFFSGMTASRFNLVSSVEGLRQEIREHVFGKELKDLTESEKKALETYTKGMMAELANLYSTEAQGQATRILDFNRAFQVNQAPGQMTQ